MFLSNLRARRTARCAARRNAAIDLDIALTHATHAAGIDLLTPRQVQNVARELAAIWDGPTGEWGDVDVFPHTNGGTR